MYFIVVLVPHIKEHEEVKWEDFPVWDDLYPLHNYCIWEADFFSSFKSLGGREGGGPDNLDCAGTTVRKLHHLFIVTLSVNLLWSCSGIVSMSSWIGRQPNHHGITHSISNTVQYYPRVLIWATCLIYGHNAISQIIQPYFLQSFWHISPGSSGLIPEPKIEHFNNTLLWRIVRIFF